MRSKTVKVVLLDGTPFGPRTAELSNWNGKVIVLPRAALGKLKEMPESEMSGVYFLLGEDQRVYVGETETLGQRLVRHGSSKDFWDELIAFTSSKLTKTEVKYLEYAFTERLKKDGLATLVNEVSPRIPTIAPEDRDAMDDFVDHTSDVLLTLGISLLNVSNEIESAVKEKGNSVVCKGPDANATGVFSESGLLVLKGSIARKQPSPTFPEYRLRNRDSLVTSKILSEQDGKHLIFTQDYLFPSPSSAAAVVLARQANGWDEWKTKEGKSLNELELRG
jgi:hypothetical protein